MPAPSPRSARRLDGIPLALELAAARVARLPVARTGRAAGRRAPPPDRRGPRRRAPPADPARHARLELRPPHARGAAAFPPPRVFAGDWTFDAARTVGGEQVAPGYGPVDDDFAFLAVLEQLIEQSLVVAEQEDGAARFRLLEPVRQYAAERLAASGEEMATRARHADCYLALAEGADAGVLSADSARWLTMLERERGNLRAALGWLLARGEVVTGLRLAQELWRFWSTRGEHTQGRRWLVAFLDGVATTNEPTPPQLYNATLFAVSRLAYEQGDAAAARAYAERILPLAREHGDALYLGAALTTLGHLDYRAGDYAAARVAYAESLELRRTSGYRRGIAISLQGLGRAALAEGDYTTARRLTEEALALIQATGDRELLRLHHARPGTGGTRRGLDDAAREHFAAALDLARQHGYRLGAAGTLAQLAGLANDQCDYPRARGLLAESLAIFAATRARQDLPQVLEECAILAVAQDRPAQALHLLGAATTLRRATGDRNLAAHQARLDRALGPVRAALGESGTRDALATGQALSPDKAIASALALHLRRGALIPLSRSGPRRQIC